jgi:curved DNA-binding protein CbpA
VAETRIIDYYAVLAVPPHADLMGVENAYARISDELATRTEFDETSRDALLRLNEAYTVLSKPELRREYDRAYFSREISVAEGVAASEARRRRLFGNVLTGALLAIVLVQAVALAYVGRGLAVDIAGAVLGPLLPGNAG